MLYYIRSSNRQIRSEIGFEIIYVFSKKDPYREISIVSNTIQLRTEDIKKYRPINNGDYLYCKDYNVILF